jgi:hypothetical protein
MPAKKQSSKRLRRREKRATQYGPEREVIAEERIAFEGVTVSIEWLACGHRLRKPGDAPEEWYGPKLPLRRCHWCKAEP